MRANVIDENVMKYVYEKNSWLYWKTDIGKRGKKDSLVGCLNKSSGYYRVRINGKNYLNHRILYQFYHNIILEPADVVDHHNRDKTDNRKENLMLSDKSENCCNQKVNKNNKSTGVKNISITKSKNYEYFRIQIRKNGKPVFLKLFRIDKFNLEELIKIRDEQIKIHHGEFASLG